MITKLLRELHEKVNEVAKYNPELAMSIHGMVNELEVEIAEVLYELIDEVDI